MVVRLGRTTSDASPPTELARPVTAVPALPTARPRNPAATTWTIGEDAALITAFCTFSPGSGTITDLMGVAAATYRSMEGLEWTKSAEEARERWQARWNGPDTWSHGFGPRNALVPHLVAASLHLTKALRSAIEACISRSAPLVNASCTISPPTRLAPFATSPPDPSQPHIAGLMAAYQAADVPHQQPEYPTKASVQPAAATPYQPVTQTPIFSSPPGVKVANASLLRFATSPTLSRSGTSPETAVKQPISHVETELPFPRAPSSGFSNIHTGGPSPFHANPSQSSNGRLVQLDNSPHLPPTPQTSPLKYPSLAADHPGLSALEQFSQYKTHFDSYGRSAEGPTSPSDALPSVNSGHHHPNPQSPPLPPSQGGTMGWSPTMSRSSFEHSPLLTAQAYPALAAGTGSINDPKAIDFGDTSPIPFPLVSCGPAIFADQPHAPSPHFSQPNEVYPPHPSLPNLSPSLSKALNPVATPSSQRSSSPASPNQNHSRSSFSVEVPLPARRTSTRKRSTRAVTYAEPESSSSSSTSSGETSRKKSSSGLLHGLETGNRKEDERKVEKGKKQKEVEEEYEDAEGEFEEEVEVIEPPKKRGKKA
ncbi:hypothetical protein JCM11641_006430 [Rhodosporidiobolus odoratus]